MQFPGKLRKTRSIFGVRLSSWVKIRLHTENQLSFVKELVVLQVKDPVVLDQDLHEL